MQSLKKNNFYFKYDMKNDTKFKEKLTFYFKYDMKYLVIFHPTTRKCFYLKILV